MKNKILEKIIMAAICISIVFTPINVNALEEYKQIHKDAIVVDSHIDTILFAIDQDTYLPIRKLYDYSKSCVNVKKMRQGGVDVAFWAAYTEGTQLKGKNQIDYNYANNEILASINGLYYVVDNNKSLELAKSTSEIKNLVNKNKSVAVSSVEGAYSLNSSNYKKLLRQYYDLGVRCLSLTHNKSSAICDGAYETYPGNMGTSSLGGLSKSGKNAIIEMNKLGMIVDVSHLSYDAVADVLNTSTAPVIASHTGLRKFVNLKRNLTDYQAKKIAGKGGLIQVSFDRYMMGDSIKDVVDTIDYLVDLVGVDHVGIGSDFDGNLRMKGLEDVSKVPNLTKELVNRGYSKSDIEKILGGNLLRVMKIVEDKATYKKANTCGLKIKSQTKMSSKVDRTKRTFKANVIETSKSKINPDSISVIIDGKSQDFTYSSKYKTITVKLKSNLKSKYHVITFYAKDKNSKEVRETVIFYTKDYSR